MPVIVEFRLRPARPGGGRRGPFEPSTRQLHGLACALFETGRADSDAHAAQEKPFTVWPLRPVGAGPAGGGWLLRGAWLPPGFPQRVLASAAEVRLGPVTCAVTDVALHGATHEELAGVPPVDGTRLTLLSPAYFAQSGTRVTDPDPRLIAGSWRRRWNASLPPDSAMHIGAALWRDIHLALHVTGSGLRTEHRDTGYRQQEGLTGTLTLRLESGATPAVRQAFGALSRFAEYCGTGAQVTHGFGATKTTLLESSWANHAPSAALPAKLMELCLASAKVVAPTPGTARAQLRRHEPHLDTSTAPPKSAPSQDRSQPAPSSQLKPPANREPSNNPPELKGIETSLCRATFQVRRGRTTRPNSRA